MPYRPRLSSGIRVSGWTTSSGSSGCTPSRRSAPISRWSACQRHLPTTWTGCWPPWGLVFTRQQVYEAGGGPVWYARQAQYEALTWELRPWAVRFDTTLGSTSDWLHEREWRVPVEPEVAALGLPVGSVAGVLIGDPTWTPSSRLVPVDTGTFISSVTGAQTWSDDPYAQPYLAQAWSLPALWVTAPHWYWDPASRQLHSV